MNIAISLFIACHSLLGVSIEKLCFLYAGKNVYFYDASWECYRGFHLAFFIVSLCIICLFVVLPIILLVIIVHRGAGERYFCFKIQGPVIDAITQGLRYMQLYYLLD